MPLSLAQRIFQEDLRLSYDNIFSFNRIRESHNIEEGRSISFGIEYSRDSENKAIFYLRSS